MNTVNPLKRPLTMPNDPFKLLVCKKCKKDDVLNLKTCGCLLCDSCDGDSRNICISCRFGVDPKIKLSFTKKPRCKYYELNKCYSNAEYKCKCIPNCLVCSSCLNYIHSKRLLESCVPEVLTPKVTTDHEPCELCKEFIAEFKMTSEPHSKVCFACKTNITIDLEKIINEEPDWNQFYREYEQSTENVSQAIQIAGNILEVDRKFEQGIKNWKVSICKMLKFLHEYNRRIALIRKQHDNSKRISKILKPNGTIKSILDLLKDQQVILHGEQGKEQIRDLLNYYREKNDCYLMPPFDAVSSFIYDAKTYIPLELPPLASSYVSKKPECLQEIDDNDVEPIFIWVELPSKIKERKRILEDIEKHQDKWVRKESFAVNDIVIILDVDATDSHKYKRAKILKKEASTSKVFLLDFGFSRTVKNDAIGMINGMKIDGELTCHLDQITESAYIAMTSDFDPRDLHIKAKHLFVLN